MLLRKRIAKPFYWLLPVIICFFGCGISHPAFNADKKYPLPELQRDYTIFRNILQESHPSVTWYTPADSMQYYFDWGYRQLKDSMTEPQFRTVLTYVISKIHCGHTSTRYSKKYIHYLDTARLPIFPVSIKVLDNDTVVLNNTLKRKNATLPKGTILTSFDGKPFREVIDSIGQFIPSDGYNESYLRQAVSNRGAFGSWLRLLRGWKSSYELGFIDSTGREQTTIFSLIEPRPKDTIKRIVIPDLTERLNRRERREERLYEARSLQIDTGLSTAYMTVNTFNNGNQLHSFFKSSFRELRKERIQHLIIDIRSNGGGNVNHSTYLTKMLVDKPFKIADSLYASNKRSKYGRYIQYNGITGIFMSFITKKKSDGKYHFGYYERHVFKPVNKNHYKGNVYVLTGPNSFSAATIFARAVKGQKNIMLVGEETGGGNYGNTAWFIPNVTLPETGIRFRLPKFRLVIDKDTEKNGRGVIPDIVIPPTRSSLIQNRDLKVEKVRELILSPETVSKN
ncbi:S41 family peptidase [Flavihumibacter profundi]|uniref:S41 family peptidase n=1 Tax=Flavihumibacter profundi TaxID=2716883 RepID=UPI001CC5CF22|nr:S41 family peptidase [Flavihumibacter profundi]MBZ5859052.1 S41 family peptidase [Flavihumibacter profundi]